jgi:hypothetical protein
MIPPEQNKPKRAPIALIALVGLAVVAVGVVALLARGGAAPAAEQRGAGGVRSAPTPAPAVVQEAPVAPAAPASDAGGDSAVARGGSRNRSAEGSSGGEVLLPGETQPTASPSMIGVSEAGPLRIEVRSAIYDVSGKPASGCSAFDAKTPVRRLTLELSIVNETGTAISPAEWGAAAFEGADRATLCLANVTTGLPALTQGTRTPITLLAFTEAKSSVTAIAINTTQGFASRVCFNEDKVVACK